MRIYKHWLLVILWMGFISFMSSDAGSAEHSSRIIEPVLHWLKPNASQEEFELVHLLLRKAAHLTEYAILGLLAFRAVRFSQPPDSRRWPGWSIGLVVLVFAAAYAATDEFHQSFVPGRTPAVMDVVIDSCGAALGLGLLGLRNVVGSFWINKPAASPATPQT